MCLRHARLAAVRDKLFPSRRGHRSGFPPADSDVRAAAAAPPELPRLVMRRAALAALGPCCWRCARPVARAPTSTRSRRRDGAGAALAQLPDVAGRADAAVQPALAALSRQRDLRHLQLTLARRRGPPSCFDSPAGQPRAARPPAWLSRSTVLGARWPRRRSVSWPLRRAGRQHVATADRCGARQRASRGPRPACCRRCCSSRSDARRCSP